MASSSKRGLVLNHSHEYEFNLYVNETLYSYERMSSRTRLEKEAEGNSEMAHYETLTALTLNEPEQNLTLLSGHFHRDS